MTRTKTIRIETMRKQAVTLAVVMAAVAATLSVPSSVTAQVRMTVPAQSQPVALQGATIHTVTNGVIENGTIVFENGVITAVGANVQVPAGARVVDVTGKHIYPGLIDAYSTVGISEIGAVDVSSDINELGDFNPNVRASVAVNGESRHIGTTRSAGVLVTLTTPDGGLISGMSSAMSLEGWDWEEMSLEPAAALNVNWPNPNPRRGRRFGGFGPDPQEPPPSYEEQVQQIKDFFGEARAYRDAVQAGESVRSDSRYLAMIPALNGTIPVVVSADGAAQINDAITWAQEEGLQLVIRGGNDAIHVADRLAANDIPVILTRTMAAPGRQYEGYDGAYTMPARLYEAGVRVAISGGSGSLYTNRLPWEAGVAVAFGLPEEEALKAVTINPAEFMGIADRVGSLEVGKDADLAIFKHHPFSGQARVEYTLVDGQVYFDRSKVEITDSVLMAAAAEIARNDNDGEQEEDPASASSEERDSRFVEWTPPATEPESAPGYGDLSAPSLGSGRLAITGATIHTMAGPPIENGTILIEDGKIRAVGRNVRVPGGTRRIQARGMVVTPGLINTGTSLGLSEIGSVAATQDVREIEDVNSTAKAAVAIHPHSEMLPITRANGVTTAVAEPVGGLIGGQSALIDLSGWTGPEVVARSPLAMQISFPEMGGGRRRFNQAGGGGADPREQVNRQRETLRQWMRRARAYAGGLSAGTLEPDQRTLELEALVPVVWGQLPVIVSAGSEEGIKAALAFLDEFQLKGILASTRDVWKVVDEIVESGVPVLLGPIESSPARLDPYDAIFVTARLLHERRVPFAFRTGGASNARNLPYHAALATAFGLPREAAWHALTLGAAEILGIADLYGSVEPGKIANLVVADGDLLDVPTEVKHVIIRGHEVDLDNRHSRLYRKFQGRPKP